MILSTATSQLLVIDVQEKLAPAMSDAAPVIENSARLVTAARHFALPVTISEQYPRGIGPTVATIREAAGNEARYFEKLTFSCMGDEAIAAHLKAQQRRQIVVTGIEAHVCVLQSALDLKAAGHEVFVVTG